MWFYHETFENVFFFFLGVGDGQGGLACWNSWGCKELDMTERLNWTNWRKHWWTTKLLSKLNSKITYQICIRSNYPVQQSYHLQMNVTRALFKSCLFNFQTALWFLLPASHSVSQTCSFLHLKQPWHYHENHQWSSVNASQNLSARTSAQQCKTDVITNHHLFSSCWGNCSKAWLFALS